MPNIQSCKSSLRIGGSVVLALVAAVLFGISSPRAEEAKTDGAEHHHMDMDHGDHHEHSKMESAGGGIERLPTPKGMSITLVQPENNTKVKINEPLTVTVKTEGMNTAGDHWHIYIDDELAAMVGAGRTDYKLDTKDIEPGEHKLSVTISNSEHKEYDHVDTRSITAE